MAKDDAILDDLSKEAEEERSLKSILRRHEEHENPFDGSRPMRDWVKFGPEKYGEKFGDFSDISVFPTEYFAAAFEDTNKKEDELIEKSQEKEDALKDEGIELLLDKIDPSKNHYFHTICKCFYWKFSFICAVIGAVIGFVLSILGISAPEYDSPALVTILFCALVGFAAGIVGRPVYGAVFGFILFPIAYPIYLGIVKLINNNREKKNNEVFDKYNAKIDGDVEKYRELDDLLWATFENRTNYYLAIFEEKAEAMYEKLKDSELVAPIVNWAAEKFLNYINNDSSRGARFERICTSLDLFVYSGEIKISIKDISPLSDTEDYEDEYDFDEHRYKRLPDAVAQTALAVTVTRGICKRLREMQNMDKDGTKYTLTPSYYYPQYKTDKNDNPIYSEKHFKNACISSSLMYVASNPNYESLKSW